MLWPKKNSYKEFDDEKKFLRLENSPPPPHNFSNGPSLRRFCATWPRSLVIWRRVLTLRNTVCHEGQMRLMCA